MGNETILKWSEAIFHCINKVNSERAVAVYMMYIGIHALLTELSHIIFSRQNCPQTMLCFFTVLQGVWSFLPPLIFPMCQNPEKIESWTGHPLKRLIPTLATPKKWQSPELATLKLTRVGDSAIFGGGKSWTYVISERGQFRTLFFSGFWHIGKFGGGKKDQTPCTYPLIPNILSPSPHHLLSLTFLHLD